MEAIENEKRPLEIFDRIIAHILEDIGGSIQIIILTRSCRRLCHINREAKNDEPDNHKIYQDDQYLIVLLHIVVDKQVTFLQQKGVFHNIDQVFEFGEETLY